MFTRNYYCGIGSQLAGGGATNATNFPGLKNLSGGAPSYFSPNLGSYWSSISNANAGSGYPSMKHPQTSLGSSGGVIFGTGTTPPSFDDYSLSGSRLTVFTASTVMSYSYDEDGVTVTATYMITNTDSDAITIGEVGLMASCAPSYSSSAGTSASQKCLIERTVLDKPVTIEAGGVGKVVYSVRFNYPTT